MRERSEMLLKLLCVVLGALLLFRLGRVIINGNPLAHATIPALPSLVESPENTLGKNTASAKPTLPGSPGKTVALMVSNSSPRTPVDMAKGSTNKESAKQAMVVASTTNALTNVTRVVTSAPPTAKVLTNLPLVETEPINTNKNASLGQKASTNAVASEKLQVNETNHVIQKPVAKAGTNLPTAEHATAKTNLNSSTAIVKGSSAMGRDVAQKSAELSPAIRARIDRITDSEILGQVIRPMPMALLGIAGDTAFLRTASGQTGLVKEGDELGGLKLLRIGINRVLVEQDGQQKELTIFSGYGGESLLAKTQEKTNDNANTSSDQRASK